MAGHFRTGAVQYGRRELAYRSLLLLVTGRKEKETASRGGFAKVRSGVLIRRQPSHRSRSFARGTAKKPIIAKPESIIARVAGDAAVAGGCGLLLCVGHYGFQFVNVLDASLAEKVTCY